MTDELPATAIRQMQQVNQAKLVDAEDADLLGSSEEEGEETRILLETMVMSNDEKANAGYVQSVRKSRGLPSLYFSPDLVKEAQRWSKHMATQGRSSSQRDYRSLQFGRDNVEGGHRKLDQRPQEQGQATGRLLQSNRSWHRQGVGRVLLRDHPHQASVDDKPSFECTIV